MPFPARPRDEQGRFLCPGCKQWLDRSAFHALTAARGKKKGSVYGIQSRCKVCQQADRVRWRSKPRAALLAIEDHARKRGRDYSLPTEWAIVQFEKQEGKCFYTDIPMTIGQGNGRVWSNVSIDRIDSHGPYSPDNCVLCCLGFNLMKTDLPIEAMETFCLAFLRKRGVVPG